MPDAEAHGIEYRELDPEDADAVFALYAVVQAQTPYGFLSEQTPATVAGILGRTQRAACVGAWHAGELVGYLINTLECEVPGADSPLVRHLATLGKPLLYNRGVAILPELRTLGIASALIRERKLLSARRGLDHALMLIAQDNVASLQLTTQAGSWLVGFERDEYCQNYQVYAGALSATTALSETVTLRIDDEAAIAARFARGWIGDAVDLASNRITMRRCDELGGA